MSRLSEFPAGVDDLQRLYDGDREAFDRFFDCWFPRVLGWAHERLHSAADAREFTDAVLERAIVSPELAREARSFGGFVLGLAEREMARR